MVPLVTVVIPMHNAESYIYDTLLSVQEQSLSEFECIIINDFSTDCGVDVIRSKFGKDKRFKVVSLRANSGACAARNVGIRLARGRYICFLDADDLFVRESLEGRVKTLERNRDPLLIGTFCGSYTISEQDRLPPIASEFKSPRIIDFVTSSGACPFNANQPMFIADRLRATGGFDEQLTQQAEDYEFWVRVLRIGYYFIVTPQRLVCYRSRLDSTVRSDALSHLQISYRWQKEAYRDYSNAGLSFLFCRDLSYYKLQLDMCNRVFEFVGMALAAGTDEADLVDILLEKLPSYNLFLHRHRDARDLILRGVKRQLVGLSVDQVYEEKIDSLVEKVESMQSKYACTIMAGCNEMWRFRSENISYKPRVVFLPHKDYHLWTISLLVDALKSAGQNYVIVDLSCHYRDERVRSKASELGLDLVGYSNWILSNEGADLLVAFNDWDPIVRSILKCAQASGICTATIVEGIQDYHDADTGQSRHAYRSSDVVFLPGEFDKKYFLGTQQELRVLGVPRVKELYKRYQCVRSTATSRDKGKVLINSNFSYGVLEDKRDEWLAEVVGACLDCGFHPIISRHPADKGKLFDEFVTKNSFYEELNHCQKYVSRFASGILEALAAGLDVIYYNPSLENVDKFVFPEGAYLLCRNAGELSSALRSIGAADTNSVLEFLRSHCGDPFTDDSHHLVDLARSAKSSSDSWVCFQRRHKELDFKTGCFNNIKVLRENLSATYSTNVRKLDDITDFLFGPSQLDKTVRKRSVERDGWFDFDGTSRGILADANELMRLGMFAEAKAAFSRLFDSSDAYGFLRVNIDLCERRLRSLKEMNEPRV